MFKAFVRVLTILIAVAACPTLSYAQAAGTGVGNGTFTARDQYLSELRESIPVVSVLKIEEGMNDPLMQWCSSVSTMLKSERETALDLVGQGAEVAEQHLLDAFVVASESLKIQPEDAAPTTKRLIDDALTINTALKREPRKDELAVSANARLDVLSTWVDLIDSAEKDLDRVYIPRIYRHNRCGARNCPPGFSYQDFQDKLVTFSKKEMETLAESYSVSRTLEDGTVSVTPAFSARVFLKITEVTAASIASDLKKNLNADSLNSPRNGCQLQALKTLSDQLNGFNEYSGQQRKLWKDSGVAFRRSRKKYLAIAAQLDASGCRK